MKYRIVTLSEYIQITGDDVSLMSVHLYGKGRYIVMELDETFGYIASPGANRFTSMALAEAAVRERINLEELFEIIK